MIQEFLQSTFPLDSSLTLKRSDVSHNGAGHHHSEGYELVSQTGETVGFVKAWEDNPSFRGYVHFDSDGNVVDWKVFTASNNVKRHS
ncbi:hypothetical protein KFJ24_06405 [Marinobacter sediminum]|uniref:hypothetical protein n=1 Tax=Marinobacter sediminum TaxID=256323 RepID=UPI00202F7139|nr:hypothetical protein [Marinobacter sediminum]MCM0612106.1 hypothetical protein [Marinobacter sediminum]